MLWRKKRRPKQKRSKFVGGTERQTGKQERQEKRRQRNRISGEQGERGEENQDDRGTKRKETKRQIVRE